MRPRTLAGALALALALAGCSGGDSRPAGVVTLRGHKLDVTIFATEKERRKPKASSDGRRYLLAWPSERFFKLEPSSFLDPYDVAFLDRSGKVVELAKLDRKNEEGVVPQAEAAAALLAPVGELGRLGVQRGDVAELPSSPPAEPLPTLKVGGVAAHVELALTEGERAWGLMFRPRMSADDGMLFAYPDEAPRTFWMMNTLVPLDIAFFKSDGTLVNVNETPIGADPRREPVPRSPSSGPARFILEMNLGWFKKNGLVDAEGKPKPGVKAEFPPEAVRGSFPD